MSRQDVDWSAALAAIGTSLGSSVPQVVTQSMVDAHAETTGDAQWIHNDPPRATAESPFGGPIAQGFLLLALLTRHSSTFTFPEFPAIAMMVNYGFDRVRFIHPVKVGHAVAVDAKLGDLRLRADGGAVVRVDLSMRSMEDVDSPETSEGAVCLVARWLFLAVPTT